MGFDAMAEAWILRSFLSNIINLLFEEEFLGWLRLVEALRTNFAKVTSDKIETAVAWLKFTNE